VVNKNWLEISLQVDGELAEAVAEILDRFFVNGVVIERVVSPDGSVKVNGYKDLVKVFGFLPVDDKTEDLRDQVEKGLWHLGQIMPLPAPEFRTIEDEDWMAAWKKNYNPILIGEKLQIIPSWMNPPDPTRIPIQINPGMAFGTGTHPSTQMCLEHLEMYTRKGLPVMDVGCGSGILSIAAVKLGASHALAVDIDELAIRNTRENAELNQVGEKIEASLGSLQEILEQRFSISQAPVVVVNILAPVIVSLFQSGLGDLVEKNGILILAGILDSQFVDVERIATEKGFSRIEKQTSADWISPVYKKTGQAFVYPIKLIFQRN
jgi:ribosomal protein L11 methyltransferase